MSLTRDVVASNMVAFVEELESLISDGWEVVEGTADAGHMGGFFTVSLYRDDKTVRNFKERVADIASAPKLSRAEILQKAREARAANQAAKLEVNNIVQD